MSASSRAWRSFSQSSGFSISISPGSFERVVLALRISLPVVGHQDPPQVGMAGELIPNMSNTSRSSQFAAGHTGVTEAIG